MSLASHSVPFTHALIYTLKIFHKICAGVLRRSSEANFGPGVSPDEVVGALMMSVSETEGRAARSLIKVKNPKAPAATRAIDGTF